MDLDLSLESNKVREGMESKLLCTHLSGDWLEDEEIARTSSSPNRPFVLLYIVELLGWGWTLVVFCFMDCMVYYVNIIQILN